MSKIIQYSATAATEIISSIWVKHSTLKMAKKDLVCC